MSAAIDKITAWRNDPVLFVKEVFKANPDPWQEDVLRDFRKYQRIAMCASKGPGKSCLLSWLCWNFLLCYPKSKIAATSISGDNLRDGLWSEMAKWRGVSPLLSEMFVWQKERIFDKEKSELCWMSARQWSKAADQSTLGNTLAGIHDDYIMFVLDESGGMPDAIMATAEGALSSCIEGHIIQAGNPTHLAGPLFRACKTSERKLWHVVEITSDPEDPKRSPRVSTQWAKEQIEKYGRDNPWVLVNVFGRFPPSGFNNIISWDEVEAAANRRYREGDFKASARILGIDTARDGADSTVIFPRQGLQAFNPSQYRNIDGTEGAEIVLRKMNEWEVDAVFIDDTGGFGSSWIDNLIRLGKDPIGVKFNSKSLSERYYLRRSEMIMEMVNWIRRGGAIPDIKELKDALIQTMYWFKGDQLYVEPKDELKERLGYSPDHMDALALTFAVPIERIERNPSSSKSIHQIEYNPLSRDKVLQGNNQYEYRYDPRR